MFPAWKIFLACKISRIFLIPYLRERIFRSSWRQAEAKEIHRHWRNHSYGKRAQFQAHFLQKGCLSYGQSREGVLDKENDSQCKIYYTRQGQQYALSLSAALWSKRAYREFLCDHGKDSQKQHEQNNNGVSCGMGESICAYPIKAKWALK